jgi:hypothetical protein
MNSNKTPPIAVIIEESKKLRNSDSLRLQKAEKNP